MDSRVSLSILLLLVGIFHVSPLMEEMHEGVFLRESKHADITTKKLGSNYESSKHLIEGELVFLKTRNALSCFNNNCLWKKNSNNLVEVPYTVNSEFTYYERRIIHNAMITFHTKTCIRFVPRSTQTDYISIENRNWCYSSLGRIGGKQVVSLNRHGCVHKGIVLHELNHVLGFYHEQNRSDRDKYVRINWKYISPGRAHNFQKKKTNNQNTPYDYGSIMHYRKMAYSTQYGKETIIPIPNPNVQIGQRQDLSRIDILKINKLYRCRF